jgi:hypothetical protein
MISSLGDKYISSFFSGSRNIDLRIENFLLSSFFYWNTKHNVVVPLSVSEDDRKEERER